MNASRSIAAVAVGILFLCQPVIAQTVYTNDFEGAIGPEWSHTQTDTTPIGSRGFLGQFTSEVVTLTLDNLPAHSDLIIDLDLFIIRSWDGNDLNQTGVDTDSFNLSIDGGPTLLNTTFSNGTPESAWRQAYPDEYPGGSHPAFTGADEKNALGYVFRGEDKDAVYNLSYMFPHQGDEVTFVFTPSPDLACCGGEVGIEDESWGLDNVRVDIPEPATVGLMVVGVVLALRRRLRG